MSKRVASTEQAKAELRPIPQPTAIQILRTLARFLASEEGNLKRLQTVVVSQSAPGTLLLR